MFSLKSPRAIKFYTEHPDLDFEAVNLILIDLLEKLVNNMSSTLEQNLSIDLLKNISQKINSLEQRTLDIDNTTKNYIDLLKSNIENSVSSQKDFIINSLRDLVKSDSQTNYINIDSLFTKNYNQLSSRITDNISKLPDTLLNSTISINQLTEELQKTHTNISKEISDTLATNQSKDTISDTLTNIIDTKYSQLNASMTGRIETMFSQFTATNNDILERVQPMKTVEEYFTNMNNSNKKGKQGEAKLEPILSSILPTADIVNSSGEKESGDFIINRQNKSSILIDTKDYNTVVPKKEVDKIIRDIEKHKCNGILMSQNSGIALKYDWEINIHNNFVIVFLHNVEYNEDKIHMAIQIIDTLYPIIQQQANLEYESITKDQLIELNREFQNIISQKKKIIEQIEQNNKDIIREVTKLDIPTLSSILKAKFSQPEELIYKCDHPGCGWVGRSNKALASHKKKHKKKETTIKNIEN